MTEPLPNPYHMSVWDLTRLLNQHGIAIPEGPAPTYQQALYWAVLHGLVPEPEERALIRHNPDGSVDEVVIENPSSIHIEQMDNGLWWMAIERGDKQLVLWFKARGKIALTVGEDYLGCVDDTTDVHALIDSLMGSVPDLLGGMSEDEHMERVRGRGPDDGPV